MTDPAISIDQWLSELERLRPADGRVTHDILEAAGSLPMAGGSDSLRAFHLAYPKSYAGGRLKTDIARYTVEAYDAARSGDEDKAVELKAKTDYWKRIAIWVDQFE